MFTQRLATDASYACYVASETYAFSFDQTFIKVFEFVGLSNRDSFAIFFTCTQECVIFHEQAKYWFGISDLSMKYKVHAWVGYNRLENYVMNIYWNLITTS